ncbi:N-6 DNA methylase [Salinibacter ruber]|jgi:type I restriction enzyme M protein|uniref:N-6 DNA methylase n=1 Tax=Salinibacter ruber TaxID=146919 RepID=UPI0020741DD6|nr:N-6 DNA methylase [Salinibacter ruber]
MQSKSFSIADILKDTEYSLEIFSNEEIEALKFEDKDGEPHIYDPASEKLRKANPEEVVRQLYVRKLIDSYGYSPARINVESSVQMGTDTSKSADIVVSHGDGSGEAYIIVELKRPENEEGIDQLKTYCNAKGAPLAVWTNGSQVRILRREEPNLYRSISRLPHSDEKLSEVLQETVTIDELEKRNILVKQKWTLKKIILDLEDLVLANAGVSSFDEVFKLVYAKLYDEWKARRRDDNRVRFRASGESDEEIKEKISRLFEKAKKKWKGVFLRDEEIQLEPGHLKTCVSFLEDVKLFNSNLQIIDEAFEYLVTQVSKAKKGQYFTPRHVIDMCVKMTNPKIDENVIDTAAGSCGFTVHSMFHVWGGELGDGGPSRMQAEYARERVYGLDFDSKAVKVAKALNLIAGDGKSNVYRVNSLDTESWSNAAKVGLRDRLRRFEDKEKDKENQEKFRYFDFDIALTNPPFAGKISDSQLLHKYDLARSWKEVPEEERSDRNVPEELKHGPRPKAFKKRNYFYSKQNREILFIERNLDVLKPGGRMAIVLPEGRLNNLNSESLRWWIGQRARILAVVSLGENTFQPHTNTKTSVLVLQKWNDDPEKGPLCPPEENYDIFFATSEHSGKDSSGDYTYVRDESGEPILDLFNHHIVDHDLYDIQKVLKEQLDSLLDKDEGDEVACEKHKERYRDLIQKVPSYSSIAEEFVDFAKRENLSFWK